MRTYHASQSLPASAHTERGTHTERHAERERAPSAFQPVNSHRRVSHRQATQGAEGHREGGNALILAVFRCTHGAEALGECSIPGCLFGLVNEIEQGTTE